MGTALSTTGNKHHTPCLIEVAISPLNPDPPHLVMGSSAEEKHGERVRGEQCVYSSGAHCISIRMMRMRALECACACARALTRERVCVRVREYLRGVVVCRCVTTCVCVHACARGNDPRLGMCVCAHVLVCAHMCVSVCVLFE